MRVLREGLYLKKPNTVKRRPDKWKEKVTIGLSNDAKAED